MEASHSSLIRESVSVYEYLYCDCMNLTFKENLFVPVIYLLVCYMYYTYIHQA